MEYLQGISINSSEIFSQFLFMFRRGAGNMWKIHFYDKCGIHIGEFKVKCILLFLFLVMLRYACELNFSAYVNSLEKLKV